MRCLILFCVGFFLGSANLLAADFTVSFALRGNEVARKVQVQATPDSRVVFAARCTTRETNSCVCDFAEKASGSWTSTRATELTYNEELNYFECSIPESVTDIESIQYVKMRSERYGTNSNVVRLLRENARDGAEELRVRHLIGDYRFAAAREIYRYQCQYNDMQT